MAFTALRQAVPERDIPIIDMANAVAATYRLAADTPRAGLRRYRIRRLHPRSHGRRTAGEARRTRLLRLRAHVE